MTPLQRLLHFLGLSLRAAAVLGLVAFTSEQGLWGSQEAAARLYGRSVLQLASALEIELQTPPGQLPEVSASATCSSCTLSKS